MKKSKLKPCPFCGSTTIIEVVKSKKAQLAHIQCLKCSCRKTRLENPYYDGDIEQYIIDSWERRVCDGCENKEAEKEVNPQTD